MEDTFRLVFELAPVPQAIVRPDGRIRQANRAFAGLLGRPIEGLEGAPLDAFVAAGSDSAWVAAASGEFEAALAAASGPVARTVVSIASLPTVGTGPTLRILTFRDESGPGVSANRRHAAARLDATSRLAGGIAHDFNNLLTAILGYAEEVDSTLAADDPRREDLREIRRAGQRAAQLTRQLLAFGRRQVVRSEVVALAEIVSGTAGAVQRTVGPSVRVDIDPGSHVPSVRIDPGLFEELLIQLAANARDAMQGGGTITLRTRRVEIGGKALAELAVVDTGCGMDDATRERCFEPFFTTKEIGEGSGLGLSSVHGIVEQSGGSIEVESSPGSGTRFVIRLPEVPAGDVREGGFAPPASRASRGDSRAASRPEAPVAGRRGGETILLVEDEPGVRRLGRRILESAGYRVVEAESGEEAIRRFAALGRVDLVLSDVLMPGLSGLETVTRLRQVAPALRALFLSGDACRAAKDATGSWVEEDFFPKPFTPDGLRARVREILDRTLPERSARP